MRDDRLKKFLSLILAIHANVLASGQHFCQNNGNYSSNSSYRANLDAALSSLPTNIDANGFYNTSVGQIPDRVNVAVLCRGDIQPDACRQCVQNASAELLKSCPNQKQAINWLELCMLRYSDQSIYGTMETDPRYWWWNVGVATSPTQFTESRERVMDYVRSKAADGGSLKKVAAANVSAPDSQTIFAFVQCSPDLSPEDCSSCLMIATVDIPKCCDNKIGGRVITPSCNLRFETYPFYDQASFPEIGPVPLPPPPPALPGVPVARPPLISPSGKEDGNSTRTIILIVVSVALAVIVLVITGIFLRRKMKQKPKENLETGDEISTVECLQHSVSTIRAATDDFSDQNKLGQGGFGAVYKGKLPNGHEIAVKRLSANSRQDKTKRSCLDWEKRLKIIWGIARGLVYLHEESQLKIIHRDLKPSNVLLDTEMNPKIADFGLARLFGQDETQGNTSKIAGTYGYMAPEYGRYGQFSVKSDVFSFGVIVLEIISGQRNNLFRSVEDATHLLSLAWENWREGSPRNMIDPLLKYGSSSMSDILRCVHIGLLCVQANAGDRPTMASVALMLDSSASLAQPSEPGFYQFTAECKLGDWSQLVESNNDASITELYPR